MFDQVKQANELLKLKKVLKKTVVVYEEGDWKAVVSGEQRFKDIWVGGENRKDLVDFLNKALKKSQQIMVKKMSGVSGGLRKFLN
jgi:hypothetical protein